MNTSNRIPILIKHVSNVFVYGTASTTPQITLTTPSFFHFLKKIHHILTQKRTKNKRINNSSSD